MILSMKRLAGVLALGMSLGLGCVRAADVPSTVQPDLDQLIAHLGSEDFDERNSAMQKIAALGETAREALEKAAASKDADVRLAAIDLLGKLGQTSLTLLVVNRDGQPLSGAQGDLSVTTPDDTVEDDPKPEKIATREDGTANIGKVEPGVYDLSINWAKYTSPHGDPTAERVRLVPGSNRVVVTLSAGGTVQGTALDADGKPLRDVKLSLGALNHTSGADGKVRIENVPDGTYRAIWTLETQTIEGAYVRVNEGKLTEIPPVKLSPKPVGGLKLTLQKPGGEPTPKSSAYVALAPLGGKPGAEMRALTTVFDAWMSNHFEPPQKSDEQGVLNLENLEPGKYRLLARNFETMPDHSLQYAPWILPDTENTFALYCVDEVEIKAGPATELSVKPVSGGMMKGRVVNEKGEAVSDANVGIVPERFAPLAGLQTSIEFTALEPNSLYTHSGTDGEFEFKHVVPGTYAVTVFTPTARTFVFNQVVSEGQTCEVPAIKMAAAKVGTARIKGLVLLPTGKPCTEAELTLETVGPTGQNSESTNEEGEFSFDLALSNVPGTPSRLKLAAAGFQPATLDLTTPNLDLQKLEFRLKPQEYGGLHVSTVDEAGKPVAGVRVWPAAANPNVKLHLKASDAKGAIVFAGLAAGPREFKVEKAGYLAPPTLSATIVAGKDDTAATITLRPGLKFSARVELPANVPTATAAVTLTDLASNAEAWTTVNSKGEFTFSGLTPGEYLASALAAGCLLDGAPVHVVLAADQPPPPALTLKLLPHGAAAVNLGAANCGFSIKLLPAEAFKQFDHFWYWYSLEALQNVDGAGRAEFIGAPGEYIPFVLDENPADDTPRSTLVAYAADPLTLQPVASAADVAGLPMKESKIVTGTAAVTVSFAPDYPAGVARENLAGSIDVILVGSQAICSMAYTTPALVTPTIVGKPPADFQLDQRSFTAKNLPAGEYKLIALLQDERGQVIGQTLLATRSLKEGESVDLGAVKLAIPKVVLNIDPEDDDQPDMDKGEGFKP